MSKVFQVTPMTNKPPPPLPPPPGPPPPLVPEAAVPAAVAHLRRPDPAAIWWSGAAVISEDRAGGLLIGYNITCSRHWDTGPEAKLNLQCKKHLALGTGTDALDPRECHRRLKRWYIMGNQPCVECKWDTQWQRRARVFTYGGSRLQHLASHEAELNPLPLHRYDDDLLDELCRKVTEPESD